MLGIGPWLVVGWVAITPLIIISWIGIAFEINVMTAIKMLRIIMQGKTVLSAVTGTEAMLSMVAGETAISDTESVTIMTALINYGETGKCRARYHTGTNRQRR